MKILKRIEVNQEELESILAIVKAHLTAGQYKILESAVKMIVWLQLSIREKSITIAKLKQMFFGKKTENYKNVKDRAKKASQTSDQKSEKSSLSKDDEDVAPLHSAEDELNSDQRKDSSINEGNTPAPSAASSDTESGEKKGHGRRPLNDYDFTKIHYFVHGSLAIGSSCPECKKGKLYNWDPESILVYKGQPPLKAEAYCAQGLRCNTCNAIFRATFPKEVITQPRADYSARAIVCLAKYQLGTPIYRLETWQNLMKVPISDSEMWEWTESVALALFPVHKALLEIAAKGEVIYNDDTKARILDLMAENARFEKGQAQNKSPGNKKEKFRKGIYTSVLLSKVEGHEIAFYCTGRKNAGENLDDLLDLRPKGLPRPVQSCDASASNASERHETDMAKCFNHARHNFCELLEVWPKEALIAIEMINVLFMNDRLTKGKLPKDRLKYHQDHSKPVVEQLYKHCNDLLENKIVEPNSGFGKAINYVNNHKEGLTLFLRNGLAPLSSNLVERTVKSKVLIRKNSYFYKSTWGAFVGDILLGTIKTCGLNNINPYNYLIAIQANADKVEKDPHAWLPWNYAEDVSCPYVKAHSAPIVEIYQPNRQTIVQPPQADLEGQKRTFRDMVRDFFKKFRPETMKEKSSYG